jgi:protein gp37
MSELYRDRELLADKIQTTFDTTNGVWSEIVDCIRRRAKCYAGLLGTIRAGHKGYADQFEHPKLYPTRMTAAAQWSAPTLNEMATKPWLEGCPRLIFISDMGDALSQTVSFSFLRQEIVDNVLSAEGQRHIWLWLTKRPARMAEFGSWLAAQGLAWPPNLVAMTTVTAQSKAGRLDQLRKVPSRWKGLSLEPLFGPLDLCMQGIDWVIVGGGSDALAESFHVEWALNVRDKCKAVGVAFFLKQLGKRPFYQGQPLDLADEHGGDWSEWPAEWRVREVPQAFRNYSHKTNAGSGSTARV